MAVSVQEASPPPVPVAPGERAEIAAVVKIPETEKPVQVVIGGTGSVVGVMDSQIFQNAPNKEKMTAKDIVTWLEKHAE